MTKIRLKKLILPLAAVFACAAMCAFFPLARAEAADGTLATEIELPSSYLEYRALNAPRDVYYDEEVTAIIEGAENNKTLLVFYEGLFSGVQLQNAAQIARMGDYLIYQQDSSFFAYSLADKSSVQIEDADGVITGSYFCMNEKYFLVFSTNLIKVYTFDAGTLTFTNTGRTITANATSNPIAINASSTLFYFNDSTLYRLNLESGEQATPCEGDYTTTTDSRLLADERYLYISSSDGVYRLDINGEEEAVRIIARTSAESGIADLVSPVGLAFRNGNLLVADTSCNKIVEFGLNDGGEYAYTGFAITTTANAYNRLTDSTPSLALNGNALAVMTDNRAVLKDGGDYKTYDFNRLNSDSDSIALGDTYIAAVVNNRLLFIDRTSAEISEFTDYRDGALPVSVEYSCGVFYFAAQSLPARTDIYAIEESSLSVVGDTTPIPALIDLFTADVDGNLYYVQGSDVYTIENGVTLSESLAFSAAPLDIGVDLNGNVYALLANNTLEYYRGGERVSRTLELSPNLPEGAAATSLAMAFDSQKIYFLFDGYGFILSTSQAENDCITNISVPENFALSGDNAAAPEDFKIVVPAAGKNVYAMTFAEGQSVFTYVSLAKADGQTEYVYGGETENFYILIGEELALVKKEHAPEPAAGFTASEPSRAYAATGVFLYYHPVLTADGRYALTNAERLPAKQEITVSGSVTVNGNQFYFAECNGRTGYVPASFVTDELALTPETDDFFRATLDASGKHGVIVYADGALSEEKETLHDALEAKAYETEYENVYYIVYTRADGTEGSGYVRGEDLRVRGEHAVRNAVIIVIVALSVAATSLYFINRKKQGAEENKTPPDGTQTNDK